MNGHEKITSRDNQRLVNARKVRDGNVPGQIFIEGKRLVEEALRSGIEIDECFYAEGFADIDLIYECADKAAFTAELPERIFNFIADTKNPQGIILIAKRPVSDAAAIERNLAHGLPIVLFLKEINNPSNLGAVLRTAEAAGVAGIIVSTNSADVYSPKAIRAAMGSSLRLAIWENAEFREVLSWAKECKLTTTATDIGAEQTYTQIDWNAPRLLVFGSEAHGLTVEEVNIVDETILIPMENEVESLNLAVSTGIILFEAKRQHSAS